MGREKSGQTFRKRTLIGCGSFSLAHTVTGQDWVTALDLQCKLCCCWSEAAGTPATLKLPA
eukprot:4808036-Amphidinium_carterae.1